MSCQGALQQKDIHDNDTKFFENPVGFDAVFFGNQPCDGSTKLENSTCGYGA